MKNQFKLLTLGTLGLLAASCSNKVTMPEPGVPVFGQFTYTGKDAVYEKIHSTKANSIIRYYRAAILTPVSAKRYRLLPGMLFFCHQPRSAHFPLHRFGQLEADWTCARPSLTTQSRRFRYQRRHLRPHHTIQSLQRYLLYDYDPILRRYGKHDCKD